MTLEVIDMHRVVLLSNIITPDTVILNKNTCVKKTNTKIWTVGTLCFIVEGGAKRLWALQEYKTACVPKNRSDSTHHSLR